jgi:hypothetical protein
LSQARERGWREVVEEAWTAKRLRENQDTIEG